MKNKVDHKTNTKTQSKLARRPQPRIQIQHDEL